MEIVYRWCRRITVPLAFIAAGILTPTAASAHTASAVTAAGDTLAKGKAIAGGIGAVCCLAVVGAIVVTIVMILRRRR